MSRATIALPAGLLLMLRSEARRRGSTVSRLVREAIEERYAVRRSRLPFAGIADSGDPDLAGRLDEIIAAEWGGDAADDLPGRR
jgi:hypothetical protein